MSVAEFYVEAASSLREKAEHRHQMQRLLGAVRAGDLVLCDKLDRWSRDPEFSYRSIRQILECGASFYAVGDQCDPSTAEGDTMLNFRVLFAREEHKRIKQRMVGTRKLLRDQGYYVEGLPPFGYSRSAPKGTRGVAKNVLVVDEEGAAVVREIYRLCIAGRSLQQIADRLGVQRDRVRDALHSRLYLGQIENSAGEWIAGKHPAIVDAATFAKAQESIAQRRLVGPGFRQGNVETSDWILRDVARCALCDGKMGAAYAGDRGKRRYYYRCVNACTRRYVPVRLAESSVNALVLARLVELKDEIAEGPDSGPRATRDFEGELADLDRRRKRTVEAFEVGGYTREELRMRLLKIDDERARLEVERDACERSSPLADAATRRAVYRDVSAVQRVWRKASPRHQRQIVGLLAVAVKLAPGAEPVPVWRELADLTFDPTPPTGSIGEGPRVNVAGARTSPAHLFVHSIFAEVLHVFGRLQ